MLRYPMQVMWFSVGCTAVALGIVGLFLPIMPTVPFMILGAFAFARSSARIHRWMLDHETFGPPIRDWQHRGAISRRAKWISTVSMAGSIGLGLIMSLPPLLVAVQATAMVAAAIFIWSRPDS